MVDDSIQPYPITVTMEANVKPLLECETVKPTIKSRTSSSTGQFRRVPPVVDLELQQGCWMFPE